MCDLRNSPQFGQGAKPGTASLMCPRRIAFLVFDVFRAGTAIDATSYQNIYPLKNLSLPANFCYHPDQEIILLT